MRAWIVAILALCITPLAAKAGGDARSFVEKLNTETFAVVNAEDLSDAQKEEKLTSIVKANVDTDWMAMFVAGKYARDLTPQQKTRYTTLYHDYLIHNYVPRFREYTGSNPVVQRVQERGKEVTVQLKLTNPTGGADIRAEYRLHSTGSGWKVVDLSGEGVSMITTQRSDFGGLIAQKGWDYFLDKLEDKVKALKG